jgi:DNA-binding NtrC family response regulator
MPRYPAARVLIVDDDPAARLSLQALLEDSFEVVAVSSGEAADSWLEGSPVDVIVSDYEMPGENGLALLRRARRRYPGVVGILLTGHGTNPEVRAAADDNRVFMVLQKSYRPEFILDWVRSAADIARARQERLRRERG